MAKNLEGVFARYAGKNTRAFSVPDI